MFQDYVSKWSMGHYYFKIEPAYIISQKFLSMPVSDHSFLDICFSSMAAKWGMRQHLTKMRCLYDNYHNKQSLLVILTNEAEKEKCVIKCAT